MNENSNKNKNDKVLSSLAVLCSLSLMFNIICLYRIANMERNLSNFDSGISQNINNAEQNINNQLQISLENLEKKNSILVSYEQEVKTLDYKSGTYDLDVRIMPKQYLAGKENSAQICVNNQTFELEHKNTAFLGTLTLPILWRADNKSSTFIKFNDGETIRIEEITIDNVYFEDFLPELYGNVSYSMYGDSIQLDDDVYVGVCIKNEDYTIDNLKFCVEVNGDKVIEQVVSNKFNQEQEITFSPDKKDISIKATDDVMAYVEGECKEFSVRSYLIAFEGENPEINGESEASREYRECEGVTFYIDADGNILYPTKQELYLMSSATPSDLMYTD